MQKRQDVASLFSPVPLALWGPVPSGSGAKGFLESQRRRFGDRFHVVSGTSGEIDGHPVYASLEDIPTRVEVAVLSLPVDQVVAAAETCARLDVRSLVLVGPGFSELGSEGLAAQRALLEVVRSNRLRVLGPIVSLNAFEPLPPVPNEAMGRIGLITQSSNIGRVIVQSSSHGVAFSHWIPTGEEFDLEVADFIEYLAGDDETAAIACYVEGFRDGAKLRRALAAANRSQKAVVVIKVGRSQAGARVASSHTAHLTGRDEVIDGLFRQYGVVRVDDTDELVETAAMFAKIHPRPRGAGAGLYGISGGGCTLMAEGADSHGLLTPTLTSETQEALHEILPPSLAVANPVDNGNLYRTGSEAERRRIFEIISRDPGVDVLVCAVTGVIERVTDAFVDDILDHVQHSSKPVVVTWNSWLMDSPAYARLVASGVPLFRSFRGCFSSLAAMFERDRRQGVIGSHEGVEGIPDAPEAGSTRAGRLLDPFHSTALLQRYGVQVVSGRLVATAGEAVEAADELGYPLVAKVALESAPHKSELGLVRLGIRGPDELRESVRGLQERARAITPAGEEAPVLLQQQVSGGVEMLIGCVLDPTLGPAVAVGMGGVLAEVRPDISVRPLPLTEADAREMLDDLESSAVLDGVRGQPPVDRDALVRTILAVADLAGSQNEGVMELDLNPVIAGPDGAVTVDSLIRVER